MGKNYSKSVNVFTLNMRRNTNFVKSFEQFLVPSLLREIFLSDNLKAHKELCF